jgi:hypothetical protein
MTDCTGWSHSQETKYIVYASHISERGNVCASYRRQRLNIFEKEYINPRKDN